MVEVMEVLGNPRSIKSEGNSEVWDYSLGKDKCVFVYFTAGKVMKLTDKEGMVLDAKSVK